MDEKRMVIIGVGAVLAVSTITLLAVTMSANPGEDEVIDDTNTTNPLLLISLDGFRSDYIFHQLPTLAAMAKNGVTTRFMVPSYPTITFPNHYTIVTGLYPESHGIVANNFYDPEFDENFSMKAKGGKWWGGEPIWNTLTRQNKTSATYFWPGSDRNISGQYPTIWRMFDKSVPFEQRVDQVVEWLSMSEGRPDWVSLYFDEPDGAGHDFGPYSLEVDNKLSYVDGMISRLLSGLRRNSMEDKVNIIVLADHGMATAGAEKCVNLTDFVPDIDSSAANNSYGAFTMLRLMDSNDEAVNTMLTKLSCPEGAPYLRAFVPQDLPTRFHYSNSRRMGDIVLDFDNGYYTKYPNGTLEEGEHGYDNHFASMHALFIATGPDFKKNVVLEPFQNIEIYNLMCLLTGVEPAPNNGTEGSLYAALLNPPPTPEGPPEDIYNVASFPSELTNETLTMANCPGDLPLEEYQALGLNITKPEEQQRLDDLHLPWGFPSSGNLSASDVLLLYHKDHVTGYSQTLKMPMWTSFTVSDTPQGTVHDPNLWLTDVRLTVDTMRTCDWYMNHTVAGRSVHMFPLFPPEFSINETLDEIPYLVSNAVPMYTTARTVDYLAHFLAPDQLKEFAPFNMILGPVFDNNADSLPDDFTDFRTKLEVPSDIFVVVTRCRKFVDLLQNCAQEDLDAVSFIAPVLQTVDNNCQRDANYGALFLATVHDVELATGLTFFPVLEPSARLQLALRIHMNLWNINV